MGDRANVFVKQYKGGVYLYTHWSGSELPAILQSALKRKERWDDEQYLPGIIFCEMVKGQEDGETGYGISSRVGDGDDRILVVDVEKQEVSVKGSVTLSFDAYCQLTPDELTRQVWKR